jgi:hypothetical protein
MKEDILNKEAIIELGFIEEDLEYGNSVYRKEFKGYPFKLQIVINEEFRETNPNCGVVSIYLEESEASTVPPDLLTKENWTKEDFKRALDYKIKLSEIVQPIAWRVNTKSRLKNIIYSLTEEE